MIDGKTQSVPPEMAAALGGLVYGLYLLTTGSLERPKGMLVSWVSQVSGAPPRLQVAVRHNRALLPALLEQKALALNLLPRGDLDLVASLGRPADRRFAGIKLEEASLGLPILAAGPGAICCQVLSSQRPGDHELILAEPVGVVWRGGAILRADELDHAYLGLS